MKLAPLFAGSLLALLTATQTFAASWRMGASTTFAENINRAASAADMRETMRTTAQLGVTHLRPLATGLSLITNAGVGAEVVTRYSRNDFLQAEASAELRKKFGLGPYVPVLSVEVGLQRREARLDGDTGWIAKGAVRLTQRFTPNWRAALSGDWTQHYAAHSTFDVRHHRLFSTLTWDIDERWQLTYGLGSLWGDFIANASGAVWSRALAGLISPAIGAYYPTLSWEVTDSYGPGWVSYRAKGRSDFWWLELSPALGPNTSLPLRYENTFTGNFVGVKYRQHLWTLGLLHRF